MNFQNKAPKVPPRILCIGMPVRDLTFNTPAVPGRGSKEKRPLRRNLRRQLRSMARSASSARRPRLDLRADGRRQGNIEPFHLRADGA
jgi:hypothetical protein